ncbi:hypothetical protein [Palaeococcus ferrophilus]|uniref:hypothetical protein n=1 Tax=Palaeococcus ferrophilus TaxID=83868 RepID=UPI00064FB251|nr:hypothetical protein [Palaeococcus ferrophilus]
MRIAVYLLALQGFFSLYYFQKTFFYAYLVFGLLNLVLAVGLVRRSKRIAKAALLYKGLDLFLAILMLMTGVVLQGVNALLDIVIIHDILGSEMFQGREGEMEDGEAD